VPAATASAATPAAQHPSVVLFDLDGTLANSIDLIVAAYQHAFASTTGRVVDPVLARTWIGQTLAQTFVREDAMHACQLEAAYRGYNEAHMDDMVTGYPGVADVLRDLAAAGVRTGVVTAKRRHVAQWAMRCAGVDHLTALVAGMEDTAAHKPDPAPLLHACAVFGVEPEAAWYVGDAVHDIEAARAAGMPSIAVTWGAGVESALVEAGPDVVCHDAAGLRRALLG